MNWQKDIMIQVGRLLRKSPLSKISWVFAPRSFAAYFKDFDKVEAVRGIFGERTSEILRNLKVDLSWFGGGYMSVSSSSGHLVVNVPYLRNGSKVDVYLDIIHELCHVRQLLEGKDLYDSRYSYVDRPTEIEAYRYTVQEARRFGLSDERIYEYLKTELMSAEDLRILSKTLNLNSQRKKKKREQEKTSNRI